MTLETSAGQRVQTKKRRQHSFRGHPHIEFVGQGLHEHVSFMAQFPVFCQKFRELLLTGSKVLRHLDASQQGGEQGRSTFTFSSTSLASRRSSSTCLSLSCRSRTISSYSLCSLSAVRWLASFLSSACRCARSSLSSAFASCFCTRCDTENGRELRPCLSIQTHLLLHLQLVSLDLLVIEMILDLRKLLL